VNDLLDRLVNASARDPLIEWHLTRIRDLERGLGNRPGATGALPGSVEESGSGDRRAEYEMLLGRLAVQLAEPGESPAEVSRWLGGHYQEALDRLGKPAPLTYPRHYDETALRAPGERSDLSLIHAVTDGASVSLAYRWVADLSAQEADRLDTRARAHVACAIYDAAISAGLGCEPGPPHGSRPSWLIPGEAAPISLVFAGFDVAEKTCFMEIGAVHTIGGERPVIRCAAALVAGFERRFGGITA